MSLRHPAQWALWACAPVLLCCCATRPPAPLHLQGAPQELAAANDALMRAQHSAAQAYAPKELAEARAALAKALGAAAAPGGQTAQVPKQEAYLVRRKVQLAEALGGQRAAKARASELQQALTALQDAAASDAWDTGEADNPQWLALPTAAQLFAPAARGQGQALKNTAEAATNGCLITCDLFDPGSSTLTPRAVAVAQAVTARAQALPQGQSLHVWLTSGGGTSPALAQARLVALASYLRAQGTTLSARSTGPWGPEPQGRRPGAVLWQLGAKRRP